MTNAARTQATSAFVPTGRPVIRFVAALSGIAAVFAALWWSGLVAPRLAVTVSGDFDHRTNTGVATVSVHNQGPLAARVASMELPPTPGSDYFEPPVQLMDQPLAQPVHIDGGDTARFNVRYAVDCDGADRARNSERGYVTPRLRIRLRVEGPVGAEQSVPAVEQRALSGACGEPIDEAAG